jgi:hypothetical protein
MATVFEKYCTLVQVNFIEYEVTMSGARVGGGGIVPKFFFDFHWMIITNEELELGM